MKKTTLCYLEKDDSYLMLYRNKKEKDINKNKWIGVGGHVEKGESIEECLIREVFEETGLLLKQYKLTGKILFHIDDITEFSYVYTSSQFEGDLKECDEGELKWVKKSEIFTLPMWEADSIFLKMMLENKYFELTLVYKEDKLLKAIDSIEEGI